MKTLYIELVALAWWYVAAARLRLWYEWRALTLLARGGLELDFEVLHREYNLRRRRRAERIAAWAKRQAHLPDY